MSLHLEAAQGAVAQRVLLPGDPLRAKYIAERFLQDPVCYNQIRAMYGFTGTYRGVPVSVQGTGMGIPSVAIYVHELVTSYGARVLVRVGSCGAIQPHVHLRDVVLATTASSDSNLNRLVLDGLSFAPCADFGLLHHAWHVAVERGVSVHVGGILSTDLFYHHDHEFWKPWATFGVLAVEMETAGLYTLAAAHGVRALALLTVSDHLISGERLSAWDRQNSLDAMVEVALETVVAQT